MPALQPVPTVARCVLTGTADGVTIVNVWHVQKGSLGPSFTQGEIDGLANQLGPLCLTRWATLLASAYTFRQMVCTDLSSATGVVGSANITPQLPASSLSITET